MTVGCLVSSIADAIMIISLISFLGWKWRRVPLSEYSLLFSIVILVSSFLWIEIVYGVEVFFFELVELVVC